jgi:hypothetical protein
VKRVFEFGRWRGMREYCEFFSIGRKGLEYVWVLVYRCWVYKSQIKGWV